MQKGLVSVITPCYNTAQYLPRLLESVVSQTYDLIEMIVIDDGSSDNSFDVAQNYIPKFNARGYTLRCVKQTNSGQSVAINNGLKMINGEFLVWPDSDDYYSSNEAIAKMVSALQNAEDEFAMVRAQERVIDENDGRILGINGLSAHKYESSDLFYDCLFVQNVYYFCPGPYMVKVSALKETTNLDIYTAKDAGQNWQLMLPILYKYRCITILEVLYTVLHRQASHSRGQYKGYEKEIKKFTVYQNTILETLDRIIMPDIEKINLKTQIQKKYLRVFFSLDYRYCRHKELISHFKDLKNYGITFFDVMLYLSMLLGMSRIPLYRKASLKLYNKYYHP